MALREVVDIDTMCEVHVDKEVNHMNLLVIMNS